MEDFGSLGYLRPMNDDDLEQVLFWRNAPSVRKYMYTRHEISWQEHKQWWDRVKASRDLAYLIYCDKSGAPMGVVAFTSIDRRNLHSSWAFYASPNAPKGVGSKMEFLALNYAFEELGLLKLWCEVLATNAPVIKLHQKFGFVTEGIFRKHHLYEGEWIDVYRLGIFRSEWQEKRQEMLSKLLRTDKIN